MRRVRLTIAVLCIAAGLGLVGAHIWDIHTTASGRPPALGRASLPGVDVGIDAWPAAPEQGDILKCGTRGRQMRTTGRC